jgi:Zn-dependent protease
MEFALLLPVLLFSIVVHEVAHAWVARREGDPTADRLGRITLNPLPHLDPVGSFLVPLALSLIPGGVIFGWAKPVPVNPANYRDPVGGDIRVSLAGIVSNLLLALLFTALLAVLFRVVASQDPVGTSATLDALGRMIRFGILVNLVLAIFNLVPIPPLDGSHVVAHLLPRGLRDHYRDFGRYGILLIMAVIFVLPSAFEVIFRPVLYLYRVAVGLAGAGF